MAPPQKRLFRLCQWQWPDSRLLASVASHIRRTKQTTSAQRVTFPGLMLLHIHLKTHLKLNAGLVLYDKSTDGCRGLRSPEGTQQPRLFTRGVVAPLRSANHGTLIHRFTSRGALGNLPAADVCTNAASAGEQPQNRQRLGYRRERGNFDSEAINHVRQGWREGWCIRLDHH